MGALLYENFFREWKNWEIFETPFHDKNGVYAFRLKYKFARLDGMSDVLYIGMCNQNPKRNKRPGLWHRLNNYRHNLRGGPERLKRVTDLVGGMSEIEYAYAVCNSPRETEKALLESYYQRHFELPPLNRAG